MERLELPEALVADFRRRNREPLCFQAGRFQTCATVVLVAEAGPCAGGPELRPPPEEEPLVTTFSRVGFTPEGTQALVLYAFDCVARCREAPHRILYVITSWYNGQRWHSSLDHRTPAEFEQMAAFSKAT